MKVSIQEKNDNPLLNRLEVSGSLEFEGATPSNVKLTETIAKELKKNIELVIVKHIYTKFGHNTASFSALVYNDKAAKDKIEMLTKHVKKQIEEDNKKAEEAREAEKEAKEAKKKADEEAKAAAQAEKEESAPKAE